MALNANMQATPFMTTRGKNDAILHIPAKIDEPITSVET
jgi:hypothetical protein